MGNLGKEEEVFYIYKDKMGYMHAVGGANVAAQYSRTGKYATVILPFAEDVSSFEEEKLLEAFGNLECM